jgi:membrane-associated phospholipid phosphatase
MGTGSANLYAAMPSMHIGWTTIGALCIAAAFPWKRIGLIIGIIHLGLMSLTVMITGNHYWLDIAGGLLAVAIAWCLTLLLPDQIAWPWNRNRATDPSPPDGPVT